MKNNSRINQDLLVIIGITFLLFGCKTLSVSNKQYKITQDQLMLGSLIENDRQFFSERNTSIGLVELNSPIRLQVVKSHFDPKTFKHYKNIESKVSTEEIIGDSLSANGCFITLTIIDRLSLLKALSNISNEGIKNYLSNQHDTELITGISAVFPKQITDEILSAESIFLGENPMGDYDVLLYTNDTLVNAINFKQAVAFAYKSAGFCWKENKRNRLEIVDIVEDGDRCLKGTYYSAEKAISRTNYFKL